MSVRVARITVRCIACGREVERTERQVVKATSGRFFCSTSCQRQVGAKPTTIQPRPCETCGTKFKPISTKHVGRFCSVGCREIWQARNQVERTCAACGNTFKVAASRAKRTPAQYCSRKCRGTVQVVNGLGRYHNGREVTSNRQGYAIVYEPDHPSAYRGSGRVLEHRLVAERVLGRPLRSDEQVHHINGIKTDNRDENLLVLSPSDHTAVTLSEVGLQRAAAQARIRELEAVTAEYERRYGPL